MPGIPGLAEAQPWTSREVTSAESVPERLAIIGGGVVGCEMATAFTALGSTVTLLSRGDLLTGVEEFAGQAVAERLRADGAEVLTGVSPERVERLDDATVRLTLAEGRRGARRRKSSSPPGRTPGTADVGLDSVGLEPGSWITVDDTLRALDEQGRAIEWLYAVGDVNQRALLTHQGKYQSRAAGDVIAARASGASVDDAPWGVHVATADHDAVPQVTFTSPEVATVGLTLAQAREQYSQVRAVDYELGYVAGASVHADGYRGTRAHGRRRGARGRRRLYRGRGRHGRTTACRDDRHRRRGAPRSALARRARVSDDERESGCDCSSSTAGPTPRR